MEEASVQNPLFTFASFPFPLYPVPGMPYAHDHGGETRKHCAREPSQRDRNVWPVELERDGPDSNDKFKAMIDDKEFVVRPRDLGLLPTSYWVESELTFGELLEKFFHKRNSIHARFSYKLFDALTLVEKFPELFAMVGVKWVTEKVLKVDKLVFGRLLGIQALDGALFHKQGNFPTHGFVQLAADERRELGVGDGEDIERFHYLQHASGVFVRSATEDSVMHCKWVTTDEGLVSGEL